MSRYLLSETVSPPIEPHVHRLLGPGFRSQEPPLRIDLFALTRIVSCPKKNIRSKQREERRALGTSAIRCATDVWLRCWPKAATDTILLRFPEILSSTARARTTDGKRLFRSV